MNLKSKSLIFLCQVYYPDEQSTSQLFTGIMERLAYRGINVKVICGYPSSLNNKNVPSKEIHNGVSIERVGFKLDIKKNILTRGLAYLSYLLWIVPKLILSPKNSNIFAVTNPPFLAWICAFISTIRSSTFIFMFLDIHPEGMIALGKLTQSHWHVYFWKHLNKISYKRAKKLLVLGRDMIPLLVEEYKVSESSIKYIPHWSASELTEPMSFSSSKYPAIWGVSESFVVQYSGNMGLWHDIDTFVRAAKLLEPHKKIQFVFIGGGIRKNNALKLANELAVKNIKWKDFVPLSELSNSLAGCHVALISLNKNLEGIAVPSKLYGILASGRPIIAQVPLKSEVAMCVIENNCGVVIPPGDVERLAEVIYCLSINPVAVNLMSASAFNAYSKKYQIEDAVNAFEREIFH